MLRGVRIDGVNGTSTFLFDLGAILEARWPVGKRADEESELWALHVPRARYVAVSGAGTYRFGSTRRSDVPALVLASGKAVGPLILGRVPNATVSR